MGSEGGAAPLEAVTRALGLSLLLWELGTRGEVVEQTHTPDVSALPCEGQPSYGVVRQPGPEEKTEVG